MAKMISKTVKIAITQRWVIRKLKEALQ